MTTGIRPACSLPRKMNKLIWGTIVSMALGLFQTQAALGDIFELTPATGERGDTVEISLVLNEAFGDFEGVDFSTPEFSSTALQLARAPALGAALPPSWVFAPPTLVNPKLGISNTQPGVDSLSSGVLAVYRFLILETAPAGVTTVTIPFQIDEVDQAPLTADITVAAIPEPPAYALFGVGLALAAWARRRRIGPYQA